MKFGILKNLITRIIQPITFGRDSLNNKNVTILDKSIGSEDKVDLRDLVQAERNSGNILTDRKLLTKEEIEKAHPFLGWCTP